jgi:hypothetical protein
MARIQYCWRCKMDIPMLDEGEWEQVSALIGNSAGPAPTADSPVPAIGKATARGAKALDRYFEITGFRETNPNALWHHRLSLYGAPCAACGKPLRTPKAKLCAECGAEVR